MLVVARALLQKPKLLMIDELSLGLSPVVTLRLLDQIRAMTGPDLGILLVEQYVDLALRYGDYAYIAGFGGLTFSGECRELRGRPDLIAAAYLGSQRDAIPGRANRL
jgi:branched-chain amino acid transport system ATP-binding protein